MNTLRHKLILIGLIGTIIIIFYTHSLLAEQETYMPRFLLDYAVVDHSFENDTGYSMELLKLWDKNPHAVILLGEFWHQKAFNACRENIQANIHLRSQKITLKMTEEEKDKIMGPAKKAADQCLYAFYYDNWDEINKTIVSKLRAEKILFRIQLNRFLKRTWLYLLGSIVLILALPKIKKLYATKRQNKNPA
jgi:hypothetical protein